MLDKMDLAVHIEEFDNASKEEKEDMKKIANEELANVYELWKHVNGKGMIEFFKFIAEVEGYLTAHAPSAINHTDGLIFMNKDFAQIDIKEYLDMDDEELEQSFQWFKELECPECGETAVFDHIKEEPYCPNCKKTINPFKKKED